MERMNQRRRNKRRWRGGEIREKGRNMRMRRSRKKKKRKTGRRKRNKKTDQQQKTVCLLDYVVFVIDGRHCLPSIMKTT